MNTPEKTPHLRHLASESPAAVRKRNAMKPRALAVLADPSRRGGVRVASVYVVEIWEPLSGCAIEEIRNGWRHVVPFSRMMRLGARGIERRSRVEPWVFRRTSEFSAPERPGIPAASETVAKAPGAALSA